jgi:biopolymer transport protein ExbD
VRLPRKKFEANIPSVAMGDIAFLLLIFFVILARAQNDDHIPWKPAVSDEVVQADAAIATVTIDTDHKLHLNGQPIAPAALAPALQQVLGQRPVGQRQVHLKIDREAPAPTFEPAIEAISMAGGEIVHILEPESQTD